MYRKVHCISKFNSANDVHARARSAQLRSVRQIIICHLGNNGANLQIITHANISCHTVVCVHMTETKHQVADFVKYS